MLNGYGKNNDFLYGNDNISLVYFYNALNKGRIKASIDAMVELNSEHTCDRWFTFFAFTRL